MEETHICSVCGGNGSLTESEHEGESKIHDLVNALDKRHTFIEIALQKLAEKWGVKWRECPYTSGFISTLVLRDLAAIATRHYDEEF